MNGEEEITPTPAPEEEMPTWEPLGIGPAIAKPWLAKLVDYFIAGVALGARRFVEHLMRDLVDPLLLKSSGWLKSVGGFEDAAWDEVLTTLTQEGILPDNLRRQILKFKGLPLFYNTVFNMIILGGWMGQYTKTLADVSLSPYVQDLNKKFSPNIPGASTAIAAGFMYPELQEKLNDVLRRNGFSNESIDVMVKANHRSYDVQTVMMLYLRKELDLDTAKKRLYQLGIPEELANELMKTWVIIPPIQDILMMVAKEAFEPDQIALYGLDEEFPEEQSEWLTKQGLSDFWQKKYWMAHWDYPGAGQVLTMLHRGLITEDDVSQYYRVIEIPTYWRKLLSKISYLPYTRVDTRRMHQMGVLTDDELIKAYMDQGYDREHAEKMAEYTKRYNAQEKTQVTMSQIIKAYRSSMIPRTEAKDLLKALRYNEDTAEFLLAQADFTEQLELQDLYVDAVKTRYLNNLTDDLQTRTLMARLNLPGARIEALMERWSASKMATQKLPSKTDLDKFLKAKIITPDIYKIEMYRLGYDYRYTEWYLQGTGKAAPAKTVTD